MLTDQPRSSINRPDRQNKKLKMTTLIEQDLGEFNKFVQSYPNAGDNLSLEDYIYLWRAASERAT